MKTKVTLPLLRAPLEVICPCPQEPFQVACHKALRKPGKGRDEAEFIDHASARRDRFEPVFVAEASKGSPRLLVHETGGGSKTVIRAVIRHQMPK